MKSILSIILFSIPCIISSQVNLAIGSIPSGKSIQIIFDVEIALILPIDHFLENRQKLTYWIYTIHNFVNYKLRNQGNKVGKTRQE